MNAVLIQHLHLAETSPWFRIQAGIFYNLVCLLFGLPAFCPGRLVSGFSRRPYSGHG